MHEYSHDHPTPRQRCVLQCALCVRHMRDQGVHDWVQSDWPQLLNVAVGKSCLLPELGKRWRDFGRGCLKGEFSFGFKVRSSRSLVILRGCDGTAAREAINCHED